MSCHRRGGAEPCLVRWKTFFKTKIVSIHCHNARSCAHRCFNGSGVLACARAWTNCRNRCFLASARVTLACAIVCTASNSAVKRPLYFSNFVTRPCKIFSRSCPVGPWPSRASFFGWGLWSSTEASSFTPSNFRFLCSVRALALASIWVRVVQALAGGTSAFLWPFTLRLKRSSASWRFRGPSFDGACVGNRNSMRKSHENKPQYVDKPFSATKLNARTADRKRKWDGVKEELSLMLQNPHPKKLVSTVKDRQGKKETPKFYRSTNRS